MLPNYFPGPQNPRNMDILIWERCVPKLLGGNQIKWIMVYSAAEIFTAKSREFTLFLFRGVPTQCLDFLRTIISSIIKS